MSSLRDRIKHASALALLAGVGLISWCFLFDIMYGGLGLSILGLFGSEAR